MDGLEPIESLAATSALTISRLKSLEINTLLDLLNYFPTRYENYGSVSLIGRIQEGDTVTLNGTLSSIEQIYRRNHLKIQKGILVDETGEIELTWYNQPYLVNLFKNKPPLSVAGRVDYFLNSLSMKPVEYQIMKRDSIPIHVGRLVPIYAEKKGLTSRLIREKIYPLLKIVNVNEFLPGKILIINKLIDEKTAYIQIHFPDTISKLDEAKKRLGFDELFVIQLTSLMVKNEWQKERVTHRIRVKPNQSKINTFIASLPFELSTAQKRSVQEILADMEKQTPMNRLLTGDVGSGKTVVAAIAAYTTKLNGFKTVIMAPTEILAMQHYQTISSLFKPYGLRVALQTGSIKQLNNTQVFDVIIGTHALLNKKLSFTNVGLIVIDEQHRFGVAQRGLIRKMHAFPHLLTMTATPIPRTIVLTLHGELDLSIVDEMPKGRITIKTHLVSTQKRRAGYAWIRNQVKTHGVQVFIICPLIEESLIETMQSIKAAKREYEDLKTKTFPDLKLGLLHGKMKSKEKETMMTDFKKKKIDILVCTSVVEVGIDIPNATIMIIEGAERFGLAQLHQLRGRVGRGSKQSYCFLFTEKTDGKVNSRLDFFAKNTSGIDLAEYDLKIRGPGHVFGTKQHGYNDLKIASLTDYSLVAKTRNAASYFLEHYKLRDYLELEKKLKNYKIKEISRD